MKKSICEYKLDKNFNKTTISGSIIRIMDVGFKDGEGPVIWCEIDDRYKEVEVDIIPLQAGEFLKQDYFLSYIGTVKNNDGEFWHYYFMEFMNEGKENLTDDFFECSILEEIVFS